jgi:hypothetical protein
MFSIGDFARHGRVSVRMLRHYDAIGLLRPASVDRVTGYRSCGRLDRAGVTPIGSLDRRQWVPLGWLQPRAAYRLRRGQGGVGDRAPRTDRHELAAETCMRHCFSRRPMRHER